MRAVGASLLSIPLAAGAGIPTKNLHFPEMHGKKDYPYDAVLSRVTSYCYARLVNDTECCLDEQFAPGVERREFRRPGTEWYCDKKNCYDTVEGTRGYDAVWIPEGATCKSPRILYIHGGSWMYGSPDTYGYGQLASKLAAKSGAIVMVPDYPLIPFGNFSRMLAAAKSALIWLSLHGPLEDCTGHPPIIVGGDSAGGGTALSLILEVKKHPSVFQLFPDDRTGRVIAGGFFFSPWTNLVCDTPDYYHHAFARIVDTNIFKVHKGKHHRRGPREGTVYIGDIIFHGHPDANAGGFQLNSQEYVGDYRLLKDPVASPMYAGAEELAGGGVPPLYFAVGASESILGDSVIVAQKAAAYGAEVSLEIFEGMWHVFPMYSEGCGSGRELWPAMRALNHTARHIRTVARTGHPWTWGATAPGHCSTHFVYDRSLGFRRGWFGPPQQEAEDLPFIASSAVLPAFAGSVVCTLSAVLGALGMLVLQATMRARGFGRLRRGGGQPLLAC